MPWSRARELWSLVVPRILYGVRVRIEPGSEWFHINDSRGTGIAIGAMGDVQLSGLYLRARPNHVIYLM